jgi:hypothetical protein
MQPLHQLLLPPAPVQAPVQKPAKAPIQQANTPVVGSQPSPSCFSGLNTVEVKDVGKIIVNQLKIGDYVQSGDDKFTQVNGFGHYDHDRGRQHDFIGSNI